MGAVFRGKGKGMTFHTQGLPMSFPRQLSTYWIRPLCDPQAVVCTVQFPIPSIFKAGQIQLSPWIMHSTSVAGHLNNWTDLFSRWAGVKEGISTAWCERLGSKQCGDGAGAVGGHHVQLICHGSSPNSPWSSKASPPPLMAWPISEPFGSASNPPGLSAYFSFSLTDSGPELLYIPIIFLYLILLIPPVYTLISDLPPWLSFTYLTFGLHPWQLYSHMGTPQLDLWGLPLCQCVTSVWLAPVLEYLCIWVALSVLPSHRLSCNYQLGHTDMQGDWSWK